MNSCVQSLNHGIYILATSFIHRNERVNFFANSQRHLREKDKVAYEAATKGFVLTLMTLYVRDLASCSRLPEFRDNGSECRSEMEAQSQFTNCRTIPREYTKHLLSLVLWL